MSFELSEVSKMLDENINQLCEDIKSSSKNKIVPGSIGHFLIILSSKITQADIRQAKADAKRGIPGNIYRLGHWLGAANKVAKVVKGREYSAEPKDLLRLKSVLDREFTSDFSPAKFVKKGIDTVIKGGKPPKITGKAGTGLMWR